MELAREIGTTVAALAALYLGFAAWLATDDRRRVSRPRLLHGALALAERDAKLGARTR